jgi:hypothetical protein
MFLIQLDVMESISKYRLRIFRLVMTDVLMTVKIHPFFLSKKYVKISLKNQPTVHWKLRRRIQINISNADTPYHMTIILCWSLRWNEYKPVWRLRNNLLAIALARQETQLHLNYYLSNFKRYRGREMDIFCTLITWIHNSEPINICK